MHKIIIWFLWDFKYWNLNGFSISNSLRKTNQEYKHWCNCVVYLNPFLKNHLKSKLYDKIFLSHNVHEQKMSLWWKSFSRSAPPPLQTVFFLTMETGNSLRYTYLDLDKCKCFVVVRCWDSKSTFNQKHF